MTADLDLKQALFNLDMSGYQYLAVVWDEGQPEQAIAYTHGFPYTKPVQLDGLALDLLIAFLKATGQAIERKRKQQPKVCAPF